MAFRRTPAPALLFALLPFIAGCGAAATAEAEIPPRAGHVFLMRGTFDVFSWGIAGVVRQCHDNRIDAHDLSSGAYEDVIRRILQLKRAGDTDPLVIGGHSNGADGAVWAATDLAKRGIAIDLLILMDDFAPPPVPRNVRRVVCIHGRGTGVTVAPPDGRWGTRPEVVDLSANAAFGIPVAAQIIGQMQHLVIDKDPAVQNRMMAEILRVCPDRGVFQVRNGGGQQPNTFRRDSLIIEGTDRR